MRKGNSLARNRWITYCKLVRKQKLLMEAIFHQNFTPSFNNLHRYSKNSVLKRYRKIHDEHFINNSIPPIRDRRRALAMTQNEKEII